MTDEVLTTTEKVALKDCASFSRGTYCFKPATMRKLAAKGYIEVMREGRYPIFALTAKGQATVDRLWGRYS